MKYDNVNIVSSDVIYTNKNVVILICLGFFGGTLSGALGLGGGVIFNPVLLLLGLPPYVVSASGLYLVTFSKIATSVVYLIYGQLDIPYGFMLAFWAMAGAVVATYGARWYERVSGRQSFIVWTLVLDFVLAIAVMTVFGSLNLIKLTSNGISITSFTHICTKK